MPRIAPPLFWDANNTAHLWSAHRVTPDEIEEIIFGCDGEEPTYRQRRDGNYLIVFGETGSGRLLVAVGEFLAGGSFRIFAARDMDPAERRSYRKGK